MRTELFEIERLISIKMDLALNNLQWLMCHKPIKPKLKQLLVLHSNMGNHSTMCK